MSGGTGTVGGIAGSPGRAVPTERGSGASPAFHATGERPVPSSAGAPRSTYLELGAYTSAVPCARLHTRNVMAEWGLRDIADTVELVVCELVTNAIKASADGTALYVTLRLTAEPAHVRIDVSDDSPQLPQPEPHALDADSGRGFEIVSMLSSNIGVIPDPYGSGKTVWALVAV